MEGKSERQIFTFIYITILSSTTYIHSRKEQWRSVCWHTVQERPSSSPLGLQAKKPPRPVDSALRSLPSLFPMTLRLLRIARTLALKESEEGRMGKEEGGSRPSRIWCYSLPLSHLIGSRHTQNPILPIWPHLSFFGLLFYRQRLGDGTHCFLFLIIFLFSMIVFLFDNNIIGRRSIAIDTVIG